MRENEMEVTPEFGKISVIVPVYNVIEYLDTSIRSIMNQTYRDIEIILVDDGSTDGSTEFCKQLAVEDNRIIVKEQENQGCSGARNTGMEIATGEFIFFVDSDDWLDLTALEKALRLMVEHDLDVIEFNRKEIGDVITTEFKFSLDSNLDALKRTMEANSFQVWKRIFRKDFIGDLKFIPKRIHQDVFFTLELLKKVEKVGYLDAPLYNYNRNNSSIIRSAYSIKKIESAIFVIEYLKTNMPKLSELKPYLRRYIVRYYTEHLFLLARNTEVDPTGAYARQLKSEVRKNIWTKGNFKFRILISYLLPWPIFTFFNKTLHQFRS